MKSPYLQMPQTYGITVMWETDEESISGVEVCRTLRRHMDCIPGEPVGMACGWPDPQAPNVTLLIGMWVAPPARGGDAAAELIDAVTRWARARRSVAVELTVYDSNPRARRAYEKYGFTAHRRTDSGTPGAIMRFGLS